MSINVGNGSIANILQTDSTTTRKDRRDGSTTWTVTVTFDATGVNPGTQPIVVTASVRGTIKAGFPGAGQQFTINCNSSGNVVSTVTANPWWTTIDADLLSLGSLVSNIPPGRELIAEGTGGFPGLAIYADTLSVDRGTLSTKNWSANFTPKAGLTDYQSLFRIIPTSTSLNQIATPSVSSDYFASGGTASDGNFVWYTREGDLTLSGNATLTGVRKVIVFVNGDLFLTGNMALNAPGADFALFVASGRIVVDPAVTALDGLYLADGAIETGASANQLYVTGTLATNAAVNLQRDLGAANSGQPALTIEFSPGLTLAFPKGLLQENTRWREVAP